MSIADFNRSALLTLRGDLGSPVFTWRDVDVPCVPNTLGIGTIIAAGGYEESVSLTLYVDRSEFLTADSTLVTIDSELYTVDSDVPTPVTGKTVVYLGATRRIMRTAQSADGAYIVLMLADANA